MDDTEQFNIRLPKALLYDLEFISQYIKINRNDWIRLNLAKIIMSTKEEIIAKFEEKYVNGLLTDKEFKELVGFGPTDGMKELREKTLRYKEEGGKKFKEYVEKLADDLKDESKKLYFDNNMKKVIKEINSERRRK